VAWLLERWFGPAFAIDDVRHVLGITSWVLWPPPLSESRPPHLEGPRP
jgi:hypothetical protein